MQVIIGRTDSAQVLGMEEAITRLKLAADAGADVCFIEGVKTEELLRSTVAALAPKPVLVNVISGGLTPSFTSKEAETMGAKIISKLAYVYHVLTGYSHFPLLFSLFISLLRCYGSRCPSCHAVIKKDRHRLHIRQRHGP